MRTLAHLSLLLSLSLAAAAQCDVFKPSAPEAKKPDAAKSAAQADTKKTEAKPAAAPLQMMTYQMVLFREAPGVPKSEGLEKMQRMRGHLANMAALNQARTNVLYGPFGAEDPGAPSLKGLGGFAVLDVPDADTARKHFANDPFVQSGEALLEVKPWLAPKGWFREPSTPAADDPRKMELEPLIFGVLVRGPAAKATPPVHTLEQRQELQKGHLAYMGELNAQGKLLSAGPFMEDGDWRGVVIYRVATVADAQALAAQDPSVKAGRLVLEARPWMTLKGILK